MPRHLTKLNLKIENLHCGNCEVLVERKFKSVPGVQKVSVSHVSGRAEVFTTRTDTRLEEFNEVIQSDGYSARRWDTNKKPAASIPNKNAGPDYGQIASMFLFVFAAYLLLDRLNLIPDGPGIGKNMSYGFIFLIGLAAAFSSCLAVAGGLLLAIAAKYNDANPGLTGIMKLKPTLYFNAGRIIGYTVLGGAIGQIGSALTLTSFGTGVVSVVASLVMIILGFQMLNLFPWMKRFQPQMPKFLGHLVHDFSGGAGTRTGGPALAGAATFFLPCGFTQGLQLYVLSAGSPVTGALTMLAFSLGTLPGLLSLSMISSFARGAFQTYFVRFAAVVVITLGFWNIQNGLLLTGVDVSPSALLLGDEPIQSAAATPIEIVGGKQIVNMKVSGLTYSPSKFTIQAGIPVEWRIDGREARGCAQVLVARGIGVTKFLSREKITTIAFTPKETGSIPFRCSMAMTTRGAAFTVIPATADAIAQAKVNASQDASKSLASNDSPSPAPAIAPQKIAMEISNEKGLYPNSFVIKKGVPVDWTIDDKVELGSCMSVMVIPKYEVTVPFELGINKVSFTPTETGTIYATCSMGSKMVQFKVVDNS
jgi:sulfite exporter TauE/SafE/copper chaperone CopZ/plastocyanin domain-containing protein